jgi:flagellar biosynthesis component FlhA
LLPAAGILFFAVLLTCAFAFVAPWPFAPVAVLCTALFFLAWWLSDKLAQRPPESVTFEGLADFRALSYVLAGESPTPRRIRAAARGTRRPS